MGGHAAWRKRVAAGGLAKGSGGAALRHRPRLGRRGADLELNRKGNLGGHGNPKKKTRNNKVDVDDKNSILTKRSGVNSMILLRRLLVIVVIVVTIIFSSIVSRLVRN
jgi:hypothetical protein